MAKALASSDPSKAKAENKWTDDVYKTVLADMIDMNAPMNELNEHLICLKKILDAKED